MFSEQTNVELLCFRKKKYSLDFLGVDAIKNKFIQSNTSHGNSLSRIIHCIYLLRLSLSDVHMRKIYIRMYFYICMNICTRM